jgi:hypothetical protein
VPRRNVLERVLCPADKILHHALPAADEEQRAIEREELQDGLGVRMVGDLSVGT